MSAAWQGWFDGACSPNPGLRGIGALLVAPDGTEHTVSQAVGRGTNNEAEYLALVALLELARSLGVTHLQVKGDSQCVIYQSLGVWGVNQDTLRPLHRRVQALRREFESLTLTWVRREENARADALSSAPLPARQEGPEWGSLSDVGAAVGKSAIWVGKQLDALGFRAGKFPSDAAIEQGLGNVHQDRFGAVVQWNIQNLTPLLASRS